MKMKIIYHCFGSAHTSVVSASIHLGLLSEDRLPTQEDLVQLPHYDKTEGHEIGNIFYVGRDHDGNDIYIMGVGTAKAIVPRVIWSLLEIYNIPREDLMLVDTLPNAHPLTKLGGFLSRRLHLVSLGRPLTVIGIRRHYSGYVSLVRSVREEAKRRSNEGRTP